MSLYQYGGSGCQIEVTLVPFQGYAGKNGTGGESSTGVVKNQLPQGGKPDTFGDTGSEISTRRSYLDAFSARFDHLVIPPPRARAEPASARATCSFYLSES